MSYLQEMEKSGYDSRNIGPFHLFMIPWLLRTNGIRPEGRVVDMGSAQGHCLIPLKEVGFVDLIAVDRDEYNFERFRSTYGFSCVMCDLSRDRVAIESDSVDAILCFHLIEHLHQPDNLMMESFRILRPGGLIFLVTPDWNKAVKRFWNDPTHLHPYNKISIARLFRMFSFDVTVHSWNARYGLGRLRAYQWLPQLGMIGTDMLAIGRKVGN